MPPCSHTVMHMGMQKKIKRKNKIGMEVDTEIYGKRRRREKLMNVLEMEENPQIQSPLPLLLIGSATLGPSDEE